MDLTPHLPALQVIVPMLASPLILLLKPRGLAWAVATAVALLSFAIALNLALAVVNGAHFEYAMGGWEAPYGIALDIGAFGALQLLIVNGAGALAMHAARPTVDRQIERIYELQAYIDEQENGTCAVPPCGWYRIVTSPQKAREVIRSGKLAVVIGVEVDTLFGCKPDAADRFFGQLQFADSCRLDRESFLRRSQEVARQSHCG